MEYSDDEIGRGIGEVNDMSWKERVATYILKSDDASFLPLDSEPIELELQN